MAELAAELLRRIRDGDPDALAQLMALNREVLQAHLERYVSAADADDLLQELWLRVWQRAGQWDGRGRPLAWLLAIGTNLALNHLRARRGDISLGDLGEHDPAQSPASLGDAIVPGPEEQVLWRDELGRVQSAMAALSPEKREALRLVRLQGHSLREAAERLGVPIGTLKSRLHHAHRLLMERLEDEE